MTGPAEARWDVVVLGAGPAGSTAARVAAERGARVLLLDAASFPRYKTCGGGLIGTSLDLLPDAAVAAVERRVGTASFALRGGRARRVRSPRPFLALVRREALDEALAQAAVTAGAVFRDHTRVSRLEQTPDGVVLLAGTERIRATVVVGADGSAGVSARHVGVRFERSDLGLEVEIAAEEGDPWSDRVHLDWGTDPGTYGWVFPKRDRLTVGVIQRKGDGERTRAYLERLLDGLGLAGRERLVSSGHLTRWRTQDSPLVAGDVLVAGDAAGLLEPWSREGISFALRSGTAAGESAAAAAAGDRNALAGYAARILRELVPEQRAGAVLLRLFERRPGLVHLLLTRTGSGAARFIGICRGTRSLAALDAHPVLTAAVRLLAR